MMERTAVVETRQRLIVFFALACASTWILSTPVACAWLNHREVASYMWLCAGLGAFGPTLAAAVLAARQGTLREVFGHWRVAPIWVLVALLTPATVNLLANLMEIALGGQLQQWFYPPETGQQVAALFVMSFGEEFGWRGYAQPHAERLWGPVRGALVVGVVWTLWHWMTLIRPNGTFEPEGLVRMLPFFVLYAVVFAWFRVRGGGSIAVAIALHAGAHLDNTARAPDFEVRLQLLRLLSLALVAGVAGFWLNRRYRQSRHFA